MKLYLVRHGEAVPQDQDPTCPLSQRGRGEVTAVAALLGDAGVRVARVEHSGKLRAAQTAEILAAALAAPPPVARPGLSPLSPVAPLVDEAASLDEDMMLVGHMPFMGNAVRVLVGGLDHHREVAFFDTATVACLRSHDRGATWTLAWMVTPAVLPKG